MAGRTYSRVIPLLALLAGCTNSPEGHLRVGEQIPVAAIPRDAVVVGWSFSSRDLLSCQTAAPLLRRIKHTHKDGVRIVAVTDTGDEALLHTFFRSERIPIDLIVSNAREYRRVSRSGRPVLFLGRDRRIIEVWEGVELADHLSGDLTWPLERVRQVIQEREPTLEGVDAATAGAT
jgi:hypothetical protein